MTPSSQLVKRGRNKSFWFSLTAAQAACVGSGDGLSWRNNGIALWIILFQTRTQTTTSCYTGRKGTSRWTRTNGSLSPSSSSRSSTPPRSWPSTAARVMCLNVSRQFLWLHYLCITLPVLCLTLPMLCVTLPMLCATLPMLCVTLPVSSWLVSAYSINIHGL